LESNEMKTMNTKELEGRALDYAVARCEGVPLENPDYVWAIGKFNCQYSTDWAQGGPIIGREEILFVDTVKTDSRGKGFVAYVMRPRAYNPYMHIQQFAMWGETHLIAAMRCYVASKLGDEVEIPEAVAE
jgi:hypothetical protein